ncbi:hypothetical protein C9374_014139 [Naegleria lovaniensis]|uniref:Peptidase C39-like domain-containing protein n=1 Tax=Naegleria lovaniensis TaxID=51637 RepID=A0AA88H178_NAELO|nr:uncharacterized protein C9374_014139 [Naegleria lovaniensis]KAG2389579.1 hypothetical protein C9374_014139 [Naegleria lovaniensis]
MSKLRNLPMVIIVMVTMMMTLNFIPKPLILVSSQQHDVQLDQPLNSQTFKSTSTKLSSYIIPNIPYFSQITDYSCGAATLQMALTYWDSLYHHHPSRADHSFSLNKPSTTSNTIHQLPQKVKIIDQRSIIDVARTSNHTGTSSLDVVRSARFSPLSSTPIQQYYLQFPSYAPEHGWFGQYIHSSNSQRLNHEKTHLDTDSLYDHSGLLTVYYPERSSESSWLHSKNCKKKLGGGALDQGVNCWVSELVTQFLKQDIPVICLMFYENPQESGDYEGHYRLAVGYESEMVTTSKQMTKPSVNENSKEYTTTNEIITRIIMYDPYDRDGNAPISNFTVEEFCNLWNYTELRFNDTCYRPYFGAALLPLQLVMDSLDRVKYTLRIRYPCFKFSQVGLQTTPLDHVYAQMTLFGKEFRNESSPILFQTKIPITMKMNHCQEHDIDINLTQYIPNTQLLEQVTHIRVNVSGTVCDKTLKWLYEENTNKFSEAYSYCDQVGGSILISR